MKDNEIAVIGLPNPSNTDKCGRLLCLSLLMLWPIVSFYLLHYIIITNSGIGFQYCYEHSCCFNLNTEAKLHLGSFRSQITKYNIYRMHNYLSWTHLLRHWYINPRECESSRILIERTCKAARNYRTCSPWRTTVASRSSVVVLQ